MVQRNRQLPVCGVQKINMKSRIEKLIIAPLYKKRNNKLFTYMKLSSGKNKKDKSVKHGKNIYFDCLWVKATYRESPLSQAPR